MYSYLTIINLYYSYQANGSYVIERRIGLTGQRSPRTPKVPDSIPDLAVSMQFGFMLKMEVPCALTCP